MHANYGYTPTVYGEAREAKDAPAATKAAEQPKQLHEELKTDLQFIQRRMTRYADKRRMKGPSFKEGDKVYLAGQKKSRQSDQATTLTTNLAQYHQLAKTPRRGARR